MPEFFYVLIDNKPTRLEKGRIMSIEPSITGAKIIMEASHSSEEPIIYYTTEEYESVMKSYLGTSV